MAVSSASTRSCCVREAGFPGPQGWHPSPTFLLLTMITTKSSEKTRKKTFVPHCLSCPLPGTRRPEPILIHSKEGPLSYFCSENTGDMGVGEPQSRDTNGKGKVALYGWCPRPSDRAVPFWATRKPPCPSQPSQIPPSL